MHGTRHTAHLARQGREHSCHSITPATVGHCGSWRRRLRRRSRRSSRSEQTEATCTATSDVAARCGALPRLTLCWLAFFSHGCIYQITISVICLNVIWARTRPCTSSHALLAENSTPAALRRGWSRRLGRRARPSETNRATGNTPRTSLPRSASTRLQTKIKPLYLAHYVRLRVYLTSNTTRVVQQH
jgi:hypothetical protein